MKNMKTRWWISLVPSLLLAFGILAGTKVATKVATFTSETRWLVLLGPLVLAGAIVAAGVAAQRLRLVSRETTWAALVIGGTVVLASAIIAFHDPARVASNLPILGLGGMFVVGMFDSMPGCSRKTP